MSIFKIHTGTAGVVDASAFIGLPSLSSLSDSSYNRYRKKMLADSNDVYIFIISICSFMGSIGVSASNAFVVHIGLCYTKTKLFEVSQNNHLKRMEMLLTGIIVTGEGSATFSLPFSRGGIS